MKKLDQEKQRIVAEFRKKWANAMNENGMAGTYAILESGLEKDLDTLHAAVLREVEERFDEKYWEKVESVIHAYAVNHINAPQGDWAERRRVRNNAVSDLKEMVYELLHGRLKLGMSLEEMKKALCGKLPNKDKEE